MKLELQADNLKETKRARAELTGQGGKISGTAEFIEYMVDDFPYVKIIIDLTGDPSVLVAGKHAVHIHEKANCDCDDFKCAGGHFDPGPAGNGDPDVNHPFHTGDLPNITVDEAGQGHLEALSTRFTLSDSPRSILSKESAPDGTSLMIHGKTDPYLGGEAGSGVSGGPRLACGVITTT